MNDEKWWQQRCAELKKDAPEFTKIANEAEDNPEFGGCWIDLLIPYIIRLEKENRFLREQLKKES